MCDAQLKMCIYRMLFAMQMERGFERICVPNNTLEVTLILYSGKLLQGLQENDSCENLNV